MVGVVTPFYLRFQLHALFIYKKCWSTENITLRHPNIYCRTQKNAGAVCNHSNLYYRTKKTPSRRYALILAKKEPFLCLSTKFILFYKRSSPLLSPIHTGKERFSINQASISLLRRIFLPPRRLRRQLLC